MKYEKPICLNMVDSFLQKQAITAFNHSDAVGLLCKIESHRRIEFLIKNISQLKEKNIYEDFLTEAYTSIKTNLHALPQKTITKLWALGSREKFLKLSDHLPLDSKIKVFRGVAGKSSTRHVRGISWTLDFEKAKWFALRFADCLQNPEVYCSVIDSDRVLYFSNKIEEKEIIWIPNYHDEIKKIWSLNNDKYTTA